MRPFCEERSKRGAQYRREPGKSESARRPYLMLNAALPSGVPISLVVPVAEENTARGYRRAHAGKLMVLQRSGATEPAPRDFFHLEDVGTHPSGLLVTGIFENDRRAHMMATAVRDASEAEIAALHGTS